MQNRCQSNSADASQTTISGKRKREWRKDHVEFEIETAASDPADASCPAARRRKQRPVPDIGQGRQQGHPEVPEFLVRATVAGARAVEIAAGTGGRKFSAQRSADAPDVHR